jgi:hypothetical protein
MKHLILSAAAFVVFLAPVRAGDDPGIKGTIAYVQKLQTSSGAFLPGAAKDDENLEPSLKATSAAVRTLHYLGSPLPNKEACVKFVESCHDPVSGGFADVPKGKADVVATAVGMMAVHELGMPVEKYAPGVTKYLSENAKGFEEIRIAVAGLEKLKEKSPRQADWLKEVRKLQNPDGTFGKELGQARATGGAVVALFRMGYKMDDPKVITKTLQDGQRLNGGFGKEDSETASDLESSYRIMRCFHMLKARPKDVEGLRSFIAKCRNKDGGYGVTPGAASSVSGTYYAAIIRHWLNEK